MTELVIAAGAGDSAFTQAWLILLWRITYRRLIFAQAS